jgi:ribosomal protein S18 acetylase RimI-like enzyme
MLAVQFTGFMLTIQSIIAEGKELDLIRELFTNYQKELDEDLCFQSFDAELQNPLKKYAPPKGTLFLACWNNEVAGCIALQDLEGGVCEMKRLYVKPDFRKHKIGEALTLHLLKTAKDIGYTTMKLDTLQKLQPAIQLYKKLGFIETTAYYPNPIIGVVYMEKSL